MGSLDRVVTVSKHLSLVAKSHLGFAFKRSRQVCSLSHLNRRSFIKGLISVNSDSYADADSDNGSVKDDNNLAVIVMRQWAKCIKACPVVKLSSFLNMIILQ